MDGDASLRSPEGECLTLKECTLEDGFSIGARHEIPDKEGHIWRSDILFTRRDDRAALRCQSQCMVVTGGTSAHVPRRPHFIPMAIEDEWAASDGPLPIGMQPIFLGAADIELASSIMIGTSKCLLPIVYITRYNNDTIPIKQNQIDDLAFKLGGIAHIAVEPSVSFTTKALNSPTNRISNGTIGICLQNYGISKRYNLDFRESDETYIINSIIRYCTQYVTSRRPFLCLDWHEITEQSTKELQLRLKKSQDIDIQAWDQLRQEENEEKDNQISQLRDIIDELQKENIDSKKTDNSILSDELIRLLGREIYPGEFADRIRHILLQAGSVREIPLDERTAKLATKIIENSKWSGGATQLETRLKNAGRDSSQSNGRISNILTEIGYTRRQSGGHPVLIPDKLFGLNQQTLSASPSDHRAGQNAATRIISDLGLKLLRD